MAMDTEWTECHGTVCMPEGDGLRVYGDPVRMLIANDLAAVLPCLCEAQAALDDGQHIAAFVAYEAAPAFDPAMRVRPGCPVPLVWLGVYETVQSVPLPVVPESAFDTSPWTPAISEAEYFAAIDTIRECIAAGETYQANFTFPMTAAFVGDAFAWWLRQYYAQPTAAAAFVNTGEHQICSWSPEWFFRRECDCVTVRPMKGTRPRGLWSEDDTRLRDELASSAKDRAENAMIVDLLRNDLGRVAVPGSVRVREAFTIEPYASVWQMTSTVEARSRAGLPELFTALFPCGSVTGAPKIQTMKHIAELERSPRGVYCGSIGYADPSGAMAWNVAIRTAVVDPAKQQASYAVGSGIVWDSDAASEWKECHVKARALVADPPPAFCLLESVRLEAGAWWLLDRHIARLRASAAYFGWDLAWTDLVETLCNFAAANCIEIPQKVRLLVECSGAFSLENQPLPSPRAWRVAICETPIDSGHRFLYHKTTARAVYEAARASRPDCDDVILVNERGLVTESTMANVVAVIAGQACTPPVADGLLAGTFRAELLEAGALVERSLTPDDLRSADEVYLINSVRGRIEVAFVE